MRALAYDQVIRGARGKRLPHPCTLALALDDDHDAAFDEIEDFASALTVKQRHYILSLLTEAPAQTGDRRRHKAHDTPEPFPGRPTPGGGKAVATAAYDAAPPRLAGSFAERYPETRRIRVL